MKVLKFIDIEVDNVREWDYPDFCDAFISSATAVLEDGSMREATDKELEELSNDGDLVNDLAHSSLY